MKAKGFPNKMTRGQMGAYKGIQTAENYPGGLDIRAGNEMGFRSKAGASSAVLISPVPSG